MDTVPLTPRLEDGRIQRASTTRSSQTCVARLPSPNYTDDKHSQDLGYVSPSRASSFRSTLSRGLSFISFRPPIAPSFLSLPFFRHSDPETNTLFSVSSHTTASSIDSGRTLVLGIGTTDKLTQKWPRPQSLRAKRDTEPHGATGIKFSHEAVSALSEGLGLGVDKARQWPCFKWFLLLSEITIFVYGAVAMIFALSIWFRTSDHADVMYVADYDILILITLAASILLLTAMVGLTGTLLNSRPILAVYNLLLWPALIAMLAVGYTGYKRFSFSLDRKLNFSWSKYYTPLGRLLIQNSLRCCGFYSPLHEATPSHRCYARTPLPGCKGKLYRFERKNLGTIWGATFALVFLHLINVAIALLCSNHVTRTFGKGITPRQYRLTALDVQDDAQKFSKVVRPEMSRVGSNGTYREDREQVYIHE
ncbi:tetraspanin Tsp2 family [Desarmillaria tabescens]|uniref:Tetraspanin Tsp2 family n=1 Tax=Armillaria tabescens TaxID=1929756 RepID=A0AA39KIQ7_ARMTA|nr:tetraspanin Tsp2 family [Desarmillaria tabescens]KAK0459988.1 tetraspanin Tsp2 family [Desarmillaria tabescens]